MPHPMPWRPVFLPCQTTNNTKSTGAIPLNTSQTSSFFLGGKKRRMGGLIEMLDTSISLFLHFKQQGRKKSQKRKNSLSIHVLLGEEGWHRSPSPNACKHLFGRISHWAWAIWYGHHRHEVKRERERVKESVFLVGWRNIERSESWSNVNVGVEVSWTKRS